MGHRDTMDSADVAVACLRSLDGATMSADQLQAALDAVARLVHEHALRYPLLDLSKAEEFSDEASEAFAAAEMVGEPAIKLHNERKDAALIGGAQ